MSGNCEKSEEKKSILALGKLQICCCEQFPKFFSLPPANEAGCEFKECRNIPMKFFSFAVIFYAFK
jgi:hypothetical protein